MKVCFAVKSDFLFCNTHLWVYKKRCWLKVILTVERSNYWGFLDNYSAITAGCCKGQGSCWFPRGKQASTWKRGVPEGTKNVMRYGATRERGRGREERERTSFASSRILRSWSGSFIDYEMGASVFTAKNPGKPWSSCVWWRESWVSCLVERGMSLLRLPSEWAAVVSPLEKLFCPYSPRPFFPSFPSAASWKGHIFVIGSLIF